MSHTTIYLFCMIFLTLALTNCDTANIEGDAVLSDRAQQIERLTNSWILDQVVYENVDVTEQFDDLQLTFKDDFTWEASNSGIVFGESGEWSFVDQDLNRIDISGEIANISISADVNILFISMRPTNAPVNGRKTGLGGQYDFQFSILE